jgi:hypothetical protein
MHYLTVSISDVRDLVIVLAGSIYSVLTLFVAVLLAGIFYFARKGMKAVHRVVDVQVTGYLEQALSVSQQIRDRTASLPGAPGSTAGAGEIIAVVRDLKEIEPPFRQRKRTWLPF